MNGADTIKKLQEHLTVLFDFSWVPIRILGPQQEILLAVPQNPEFWDGIPIVKERLCPVGEGPKLVSLQPGFLLGCFPLTGLPGCEAAVGPVYIFNQPFPPLTGEEEAPLGQAEMVGLLSSSIPSMSAESFCAYVRLLIKQLQHREVSIAEILEQNFAGDCVPGIQEELFSTEFRQREEINFHSPYEAEKRFIRNIQNGNMEAVEAAILKTRDLNIGTLSRDSFRQICYVSIALVTLVTRAAIEGGMDETFAFHLSDIYIRRMDAAASNKEIIEIAMRMLRDFTLRMREQKARGKFSKPVTGAVHYIRLNLHNPMTVSEIAAHVGLSTDHLSRMFRRETGELISAYIQRERIEEAKDALRFSSYSSLEISNVLCFSSQSYFNQIFKKHTGLTPSEYRKKYQ